MFFYNYSFVEIMLFVLLRITRFGARQAQRFSHLGRWALSRIEEAVYEITVPRSIFRARIRDMTARVRQLGSEVVTHLVDDARDMATIWFSFTVEIPPPPQPEPPPPPPPIYPAANLDEYLFWQEWANAEYV